jgi:hypothetical protein
MNNYKNQQKMQTPSKTSTNQNNWQKKSKTPKGYAPVSPIPNDYIYNNENIAPNLRGATNYDNYDDITPRKNLNYNPTQNLDFSANNNIYLDKNLSQNRPRSFLPASMPIDPLSYSNMIGKKVVPFGKNALKSKKKVNFLDKDANEEVEEKSLSKEYSDSNREHAKAITMKIRINSIRDRWLMNIRPFDYEIYVASSFMLIRTKEEIEFIRQTGMSRLSVKDSNNLLHFLE